MLRVGLTGGLASGKSFIGARLGELGCHLIRADELGHAVIAPEGEAYAAVVEEFGRAILKENGTIDRRRLAALVFEAPFRLAKLNAIVHPAVFARERRMMQEIAEGDPGAIVVVEAAIMIESGSHKHYQKLIVASCGEEQQIERAMKRDGMNRQEAVARLESQMPLAEKAKFADYLIDTSGSKQDAIRQTDEVYQSLRRLPQ